MVYQKQTFSLSDQRIFKDDERLAWDRIYLELLNASHVAEFRRVFLLRSRSVLCWVLNAIILLTTFLLAFRSLNLSSDPCLSIASQKSCKVTFGFLSLCEVGLRIFSYVTRV